MEKRYEKGVAGIVKNVKAPLIIQTHVGALKNVKFVEKSDI